MDKGSNFKSGGELGDVRLDLDVLHNLESDLELGEKISLVFLLYDDIPVAQQKLFITIMAHIEGEGKTTVDTNLLHEWACMKKIHWKETLVEALLIIKAYSNVKKLLLNVEDMKNIFHPHISQMCVYINPVKKVLFNICESLISKEVEDIIHQIRNDYSEKNVPVTESYKDIKYYTQSFELYLLELMMYGYIRVVLENINNGLPISKMTDMNGLINILYKCGHETHGEALKYAQNNINGVKPKCEAGGSQVHLSLSSDNNTESLQIRNNTNGHFPITNVNIMASECIYRIHNPGNLGLIYIINQIKFENKVSGSKEIFSDREGTLADEERLVKTWKSFGFVPIVKRNMKFEDIFVELETTLKKSVKLNHSSFVLCIMSHGVKDSIISSDCRRVSIDDIEKMFDTSEAPLLAGKPKILLIQSCQGDSKLPTVLPPIKPKIKHLQFDGPAPAPANNPVPEKSDLYKFYSTIPHYKAFRDTEDGTWFIQTLCDHLDKVKPGSSVDFNKLCVDVTRDVSEKRNEEFAQMPETRSTFTKSFYITKLQT